VPLLANKPLVSLYFQGTECRFLSAIELVPFQKTIIYQPDTGVTFDEQHFIIDG